MERAEAERGATAAMSAGRKATPWWRRVLEPGQEMAAAHNAWPMTPMAFVWDGVVRSLASRVRDALTDELPEEWDLEDEIGYGDKAIGARQMNDGVDVVMDRAFRGSMHLQIVEYASRRVLGTVHVRFAPRIEEE